MSRFDCQVSFWVFVIARIIYLFIFSFFLAQMVRYCFIFCLFLQVAMRSFCFIHNRALYCALPNLFFSGSIFFSAIIETISVTD